MMIHDINIELNTVVKSKIFPCKAYQHLEFSI